MKREKEKEKTRRNKTTLIKVTWKEKRKREMMWEKHEVTEN